LLSILLGSGKLLSRSLIGWKMVPVTKWEGGGH
jgi:hypothetical protein